ncbi:hypothetical protein QN277_024242 [Acacia crassicarpa]|uniref:Uncharacterized protein n=1 Tax=Acacia crassicarpa TaxID=499986 RepID=A0AAE1JG71_9FABA|nr:hypothetical protein QN277_024242 [Acacia crassicarpa]
MELQFVEKGFDYAGKRKKWLFLLASLGFTGYDAFKIYHSPSIIRKRKRLSKLLGALISVSEAVSESAAAVGVVSRDMKEFVQSDSDQLPNSLKQISKITRYCEFSDSLVRLRAGQIKRAGGFQIFSFLNEEYFSIFMEIVWAPLKN